MIATLGLAATILVAQPALGQTVNPVTVNPGAGTGSGINLTIPQYGPTVIYSSPYGYGGVPYGYGGVGAVSSGWTGPIPGYGGYGFGPFGYNSVGDSPLAQQQQLALANSRYDLQNAQAAKAYAQANFFQQQAVATAMQNTKNAPPPIREQFNVRTAAPKSRKHAAKAAPAIPLDKLMTPDGSVQWPDAAPANQARNTFDDKAEALARTFSSGKKPTVREVNEARDALYAYGTPALAEVRSKTPDAAQSLKDFLNGMDATLVSWAK
jgi:hypothetical protein